MISRGFQGDHFGFLLHFKRVISVFSRKSSKIEKIQKGLIRKYSYCAKWYFSLVGFHKVSPFYSSLGHSGLQCVSRVLYYIPGIPLKMVQRTPVGPSLGIHEYFVIAIVIYLLSVKIVGKTYKKFWLVTKIFADWFTPKSTTP